MFLKRPPGPIYALNSNIDIIMAVDSRPSTGTVLTTKFYTSSSQYHLLSMISNDTRYFVAERMLIITEYIFPWDFSQHLKGQWEKCCSQWQLVISQARPNLNKWWCMTGMVQNKQNTGAGVLNTITNTLVLLPMQWWYTGVNYLLLQPTHVTTYYIMRYVIAFLENG